MSRNSAIIKISLRSALRKGLCTSTSTVIITPPLIKTNGPGLGPAMLRGAFEGKGYNLVGVDMNISMANTFSMRMTPDASANCRSQNGIRGDHDKDNNLWDHAGAEFNQAMSDAFSNLPHVYGERVDALRHMWFGWSELRDASAQLLETPYGHRLRSLLHEELTFVTPPAVVGISVMFSSQVVVAMSITTIMREMYRDVKIVWGGPHVSALKEAIKADECAYLRGFGADLFISGYAEKTFVELTSLLKQGISFESAVCTIRHNKEGKIIDGCGDMLTRPIFPRDLRPYISRGARLTLPCQLRRGCSYGRCEFCTYPQVEGKAQGSTLQTLDILANSGVIQLAEQWTRRGHPTVVSFKDALMAKGDLQAVARHMLERKGARTREKEKEKENGEISPSEDVLLEGCLEWSACTKLSDAIANRELLGNLYAGGCRTLELGIETLDTATMTLISKSQSEDTLYRMLDAAAAVQLPLVLNYITGFPGEGKEAVEAYARLRKEVERRKAQAGLIASIEHNTFQLERLSPMGQDPRKYGLALATASSTIPAATVLPHSEITVER